MVLRPLIAFLGAIALACAASGDTLKLLDGKVVQGTFLGGDARTIRMEVNNKIELFPIAQVESLTFGGGLMAAAAPEKIDTEKIDPKKAKEEEKARKKAEEEAAKAAKEAAKAQEAAAKAAAKAEEAAAKAKGISGDATQAASKPKTSRWGKAPSVTAPAVQAPAVQAPAVTAPAPPPAAATAVNSANQAAATAQQVSSAVADPGAAAANAAQNAAAGAVSNATGSAAPVVGAAQQAASTTQSVQSAARTAETVASPARPSGASSAASSSGRAEPATSAPAAPATPAAPVHAEQAPAATSPAPAPAQAQPSAPSPASATPPPVSATPAAAVPPADPSAQETAAVVTGTVFRVRLVETINSAVHKPGEVFRASLENPLVSGNVTVPKGADVMVRLVQVPARGSASTLLTLEAISLRVDYRNLPFAAEAMTQPGDALRGATGGNGIHVFRGIERLQIPADGVVSFRTVKADNKR